MISPVDFEDRLNQKAQAAAADPVSTKRGQAQSAFVARIVDAAGAIAGVRLGGWSSLIGFELVVGRREA